MNVIPYLEFEGRCEEALTFYKEKIGAKLGHMMRFKDSPDQTQISPEVHEKIMHTEFFVGDTKIFASDGYCSGNLGFQGISLTLILQNEAETEQVFENLLSGGGDSKMALATTFFAKKFGLVQDKFGVNWILMCY